MAGENLEKKISFILPNNPLSKMTGEEIAQRGMLYFEDTVDVASVAAQMGDRSIMEHVREPDMLNGASKVDWEFMAQVMPVDRSSLKAMWTDEEGTLHKQDLTATIRSDMVKSSRLEDVKYLHLACDCDLFDPHEQYIGVMIYYVNGSVDYTFQNGRHAKAGYVYIKSSKSLEMIRGDTMHEKCLRSLAGDELDLLEVGACGFAYGAHGKLQWEVKSSTYNLSFLQRILPSEPSSSAERKLGLKEQYALSKILRDHYICNNFPANVEATTAGSFNIFTDDEYELKP